jgi:CheY-like chemotaxis protein
VTVCGQAMDLRLMIVDDNHQFCEAARDLLELEGVHVLAVARSGTEAVEQAQHLRPDVILVDVDLGEENGFDIAPLLAGDAGASPAVIMISAYDEQDLGALVAAGPAVGFIAKTQLSGATIRALLRTVEGWPFNGRRER